MDNLRVETALFLIESLDGKISSGEGDMMDIDADWKRISGIKEGLYQYYDLEKQTDLCSLNTGKVMAKIGVNSRENSPAQIPVSFVIIDSKPHLKASGILYLTMWVQTLYLVTSNPNHPAFSMQDTDNLVVLHYQERINFADLFMRLKQEYQIERVTIQSGGTLNATLIREKLIDHVSIVIAPALVGGRDTPTLVDGVSLKEEKELLDIKALKLKRCTTMEHSYVHLMYDVVQESEVEKLSNNALTPVPSP